MKTLTKQFILAIFAVFAFNQAAQAGLLLEPYIGYASGQEKQTTTANYKGTEYGARVGYSILGFAAGAEYSAISFTDDSTPSQTLTNGDLGFFVAYKFPVLFRAFASYAPSSEIKDSSNGITSTLKSGNAMKIGVGYTGFPFININFEYQTSTYSKINSSGVDFPLSPSLTTTGYAITISAPFYLF